MNVWVVLGAVVVGNVVEVLLCSQTKSVSAPVSVANPVLDVHVITVLGWLAFAGS